MTLATRCAACGTAFRVVEDQLKVSDGWVRCGSCNGVFNASENLFHLPRETPSAAVDSTAGASKSDAVGTPSVVDIASDEPMPAVQKDLPVPAPQAEPEPEFEAEAEAEPEPETEADAKPETQPRQPAEAELEPHPGPSGEPGPEALREPIAVPESELEVPPQAEVGPTSGPEVELEAAHPAEKPRHRVDGSTESARRADADRDPDEMVSPAPPDVPSMAAQRAGAPALELAARDTPPALAEADDHRSEPESTDTTFQSTVAITDSSELPTSGFGASQRHSAFRDSDAPPDSRIDAHLFKPRRGPATKTLSERDRPDFSDARFDSDLMAYGEEAAVADTAAPEAPVEDLSTAEPHPAPAFLREAERNARWQRPKVRIALSLVAAALTIVGLLQMAHHFRDTAAVRWPGLRPVLAQWCGIAGCTIEPLRRIEAISVENTSLAKAPGTEAFRLAVGLRNRGSVPIALPSIDLSLTDGAGRLVARKALTAAEFKPPSLLLQPGADVVLQTLLSARGLQVSGYTVEVFYP